MPTILQLTDLHLMSEALSELKGVRVRDITAGVIDEVRRQLDSGHWECDWIVISGDLAHDELRATYLIFRELLGELLPRCLLLPGNHDSRPLMRNVFPELFATDDEFLTFSVKAGDWRLLGLDSHAPGKGYGQLGSQQLDWLAREMHKHAEQPTVLFLHHPPFAIGSAWLDAIGLKDTEELMQCVASATQVKAICAGHVHQEFKSEMNGIQLLTTPSASLQFMPNAEELELDTKPAGIRILHLDKRFESEVVRLP
jgi:Icc protein